MPLPCRPPSWCRRARRGFVVRWLATMAGSCSRWYAPCRGRAASGRGLHLPVMADCSAHHLLRACRTSGLLGGTCIAPAGGTSPLRRLFPSSGPWPSPSTCISSIVRTARARTGRLLWTFHVVRWVTVTLLSFRFPDPCPDPVCCPCGPRSSPGPRVLVGLLAAAQPAVSCSLSWDSPAPGGMTV